MKIHILIPTVLVFVGTMVLRAAEQGDLCKAWQQGRVRESMLQHLPQEALAELAKTCSPMRAAVEQERERRYKIWLERTNDAVSVNFSEKRQLYPHNEAFQKYVLDFIDKTSKASPGKWINLDLSNNDLDGKFGEALLRAIVTKVHSLGSDIVDIDLRGNTLIMLPRDLDLINLRDVKTGDVKKQK